MITLKQASIAALKQIEKNWWAVADVAERKDAVELWGAMNDLRTALLNDDITKEQYEIKRQESEKESINAIQNAMNQFDKIMSREANKCSQ